jgi:hypothetical protein
MNHGDTEAQRLKELRIMATRIEIQRELTGEDKTTGIERCGVRGAVAGI